MLTKIAQRKTYFKFKFDKVSFGTKEYEITQPEFFK